MSIYLGGSRSLQSPSRAVSQVVQAALIAGHKIHVGCCLGADALVISSALICGGQSSLVVFAISSQSGQGVCSLSSSMPAIAEQAGAVVQWLAGGSLAVPLAGRLISRSRAALRGCSAAVFFSPGPGSLAVAGHAVNSSIPVFAFGDQPAPIPGLAGQWVASFNSKNGLGQIPVQFLGFSCWQWQAAQLSF